MSAINKLLTRIKAIDGVVGCILVKKDGQVLGHIVDTPDTYSSLVAISNRYAKEIMETCGFTFLRSLSFARTGNQGFHMFPVNDYYVGIVQSPDTPQEKMINQVNHLLSFVKISSKKQENRTNVDREQGGL